MTEVEVSTVNFECEVNMDQLPRIIVCFGIEGKELNINELTETLDIIPTHARGIDDWPEIIKKDLTFPEELQPRCEWGIDYEVDLCNTVNIPIMSVIDQLKGKEDKIFEFCEKNNLKRYLTVVIHAKAMCLPEITLSPYVLRYFGEMGVEIGFDIYTY
ncbi:MAG: DUF4279 domain-containing protein [Lachnospiraceae bacterium]|nr:DUF4279 domain-containing protein [Lachnospiraceae bacterium]